MNIKEKGKKQPAYQMLHSSKEHITHGLNEKCGIGQT